MKIKDNITVAALAVGLIWVVYVFELVFPGIKYYGIQPRTLHGLWGIVLSPFLHGSLAHISANSPPLFILLLLSLAYNRKLAVEAIALVMIAGGGLVWLVGGSFTNHIGASGVIFGLIGFLLFIGLVRREAKALIFSILVLFMYGGTLLSNFMPREGVSWIGHLFGFLAGAGAAWLAGPPEPGEDGE